MRCVGTLVLGVDEVVETLSIVTTHQFAPLRKQLPDIAFLLPMSWSARKRAWHVVSAFICVNPRRSRALWYRSVQPCFNVSPHIWVRVLVDGPAMRFEIGRRQDRRKAVACHSAAKPSHCHWAKHSGTHRDADVCCTAHKATRLFRTAL